jgi:tetratricopeptide (TPR) repeat protein
MRAALRFFSAAAIASLSSVAPNAGADPADVSQLLQEAFELRRAHRNEEALKVYARAFSLAPSPAVRAQLALAEQSLGRWLDAERDLEAALGTSDPWVEKNRAALEDARGLIGQHLAWLTVDVTPQGAQIQLDGLAIPQGTETRVPAGGGILEVQVNAHVPDIRRVSLGPGEHAHAQITLSALVAAAPELPPPVGTAPGPIGPPPTQSADLQPLAQSSPAPSRFPLGPIALGVVGLAGIGVGAY